MTPRALIVDDERAECQLVADALGAAGFATEWVQHPEAALALVGQRAFDVVITDLTMPAMSGTELCRRVKDARPNLPVIVVTAFGSIDAAVAAMRAGAYDFISKPFDVDAVALVLERAVEHHALRREVDALRRVTDKSQQYGTLIGTSEAMRRLYGLIEQVKDSDATLLLTGSSGTGKELVAREVHRRGKRGAGPLVALNCAAVPESLLEAELFGHEKGAFTDARFRREGLLVAASGGTVLLDEIGDMPMLLQSKLLRALEERAVRAVGSTREVAFDARLIASTHRDLELAVEQGRFREDLYYRINVIHIELPPLRARGGDVLLLAQTFLAESAVRNGRSVTGISARAAERLAAYDWPGNVRELKNCIERGVTLAHADVIDLADLPQKIREFEPRHLIVVGDDPNEILPLEEVERRYILKVVEAYQGNKSRAARALGIGRKTLYRRLESFGVETQEEDD
jgi:two-component system response regulator HydG